jgi:hypothetical protein
MATSVRISTCGCGCGQTFFFEQKSRPRLYVNKTHRQRAYRARAQALICTEEYIQAGWIPFDGDEALKAKRFMSIYNEYLSLFLARNRGR